MNLDEAVNAILRDSSALTALVPVARIRVPGNYQNLPRPWIAHFPVSLEPTYTHSELVGLRIWPRYQVSVFADSFGAGRPIADAVIDAMTGNHDGVQIFLVPGGFRHFRGTEPDSYQFVLEFRIAEALS